MGSIRIHHDWNSESILTNYSKQLGFKRHFIQGKLIDYISVVVTFVFLSFPEFLQFCFSSFCKGARETFATSWQSDWAASWEAKACKTSRWEEKNRCSVSRCKTFRWERASSLLLTASISHLWTMSCPGEEERQLLGHLDPSGRVQQRQHRLPCPFLPGSTFIE